MIRICWYRIVPVIFIVACTPLGLWLYEDPVVTVSRVTLELKEARRPGGAPLVVALAVDNRNTFALSTERLELSLRLDGVPIGKVDRDSSVPVAMATISTVALALPVREQTAPEHLATLGAGAHTFAVQGRATFRTPFGTREVRFEQEGAMMFGKRPNSSVP
jgi:LEA14-like dessication related protein